MRDDGPAEPSAAGRSCFTAQDFANLRCELNPESMHVPRAEAGGCSYGAAEFLPFSPTQFGPYRIRTRLFRTERRFSRHQSETAAISRPGPVRRTRPFGPRE